MPMFWRRALRPFFDRRAILAAPVRPPIHARRSVPRLLCHVALALALVTSPTDSGAANMRPNVMVVGNDLGGVLTARLAQLQSLKLRDTTVEIRGDICASACTLYLGLPRACVLPGTMFGFHGPSHYGRPLAREDYERLSQVVAAQYPLFLRDWYMTAGRKTLVKMTYITGQTLIDFGLRQCAPAARS